MAVAVAETVAVDRATLSLLLTATAIATDLTATATDLTATDIATNYIGELKD